VVSPGKEVKADYPGADDWEVGRMLNETEPKRVLVVDDDRDFVQALERYLKVAGYEVSCAYGGMGALEEIRVGNPNAVILDVMMPDIDGRQVVRHIREKMGDRETAVIVLSALTDRNSRTNLMIDGANDYLTKPCDPARISKSVDHFTSKAGQNGTFIDSVS
jgi:DNA-binding response OmpR family regulator